MNHIADRFEQVLDRVEEIDFGGKRMLRCLKRGHLIVVPQEVFDAPVVTTHAHCGECEQYRDWDGPGELN